SKRDAAKPDRRQSEGVRSPERRPVVVKLTEPAAPVGTRLVGLRFENSPSRAGRRTSRLRAHGDACHGSLRCENFSSPRERSEHETCERTMFKFDGSHRRTRRLPVGATRWKVCGKSFISPT